eukprot:COSAG02_NODE_12181_length_1583_cov_5.828841_1_plen_170_part_10
MSLCVCVCVCVCVCAALGMRTLDEIARQHDDHEQGRREQQRQRLLRGGHPKELQGGSGTVGHPAAIHPLGSRPRLPWRRSSVPSADHWAVPRSSAYRRTRVRRYRIVRIPKVLPASRGEGVRGCAHSNDGFLFLGGGGGAKNLFLAADSRQDPIRLQMSSRFFRAARSAR